MELPLPSFVYVGTEAVFFILLLAYAVHGSFLCYHWFTYGQSRELSLMALSVYLVGGVVLFLTLGVSLKLL